MTRPDEPWFARPRCRLLTQTMAVSELGFPLDEAKRVMLQAQADIDDITAVHRLTVSGKEKMRAIREQAARAVLSLALTGRADADDEILDEQSVFDAVCYDLAEAEQADIRWRTDTWDALVIAVSMFEHALPAFVPYRLEALVADTSLCLHAHRPKES